MYDQFSIYIFCWCSERAVSFGEMSDIKFSGSTCSKWTSGRANVCPNQFTAVKSRLKVMSRKNFFLELSRQMQMWIPIGTYLFSTAMDGNLYWSSGDKSRAIKLDYAHIQISWQAERRADIGIGDLLGVGMMLIGKDLMWMHCIGYHMYHGIIAVLSLTLLSAWSQKSKHENSGILTNHPLTNDQEEWISISSGEPFP